MIEGFKDSRSQGFKGNAKELQRAEGLGEILSTMFRGLSDDQRISQK
jgi:hypothetical protein